MPGPYGSPEFRAAYEEACEGARLAEHGTTEWEVMAFLAHRTAKEASRYTAAANRARLTTTGMAKLGAEPDKFCPTFPKGWANGVPNAMKYMRESEWVVTPTGIEPVSPP